MAPYCQAIDVVQYSSSNAGVTIFTGTIDPEWSVGTIAHGGYILGLVVESGIQLQHRNNSPHPDPIHVTAHFLQSALPSTFVVEIRVLKTGRGFTNMTAEFKQSGNIKVMSHMIFGTLEPPSLPDDRIAVEPPSTYARRIPLHFHPSEHEKKETARSIYTFRKRVKFREDPYYTELNRPDHPRRADINADTVGGGGAEWASWFELTDTSDKIGFAAMPLLVDLVDNFPRILPREVTNGKGYASWFPTLVMNVEFKARIPASYSNRTVGLYTRTSFLGDPQGRHGGYAEIWTAPSNIGEGTPEPGWREKQICLATGDQMALMIPIAAQKNISAKSKL